MNSFITIQEKEYLKELKDILKLGKSLFKNSQIGAYSKSYKKNFIFFTFVVIHNYSEAIYILCKNSRPHASYVLLRSIFEAYVNMLYFTNTNSNLPLAKYVILDFKERIKTLNNFKEFIKKYPSWKDKYEITNLSNLDNLISKQNKNIEAVKKGNKFYRTTKIEKLLRERAKAYDQKTRNKGELEFNYILIYKYFSLFTHLTPTGIEHFLKKERGKTKYEISQAKDVEPIIATTFGFYKRLLD